MDDVVQAGLLARGSSPFSAFPGPHGKAQWRKREGLAADSCGGSFGFASPLTRRGAPNSLLADQRDRRT